jgi:hypothetical protein
MKPLILQFSEIPGQKNLDYSIIEYSKRLNLSVLKNTETPAISYVNMDTETITKAIGETTDSDYDNKLNLKRLFDTSTETHAATEPSDNDHNYSSLKLLLDTQTITESIEPTDSDK